MVFPVAAITRAAFGGGKRPPIRVSMNIQGAAKLDRVLLGINKGVTDLREPYGRLADHFEEVMIPRAFEDIDRKGYYPVESSYVKYKKSILGMRDESNDPPVLRWTRVRTRRPGPQERLYPSLVERTDPNHVRDVKKDSLRIGTSLDYAEKHQEGKGRGPAQFGGYPLPRREMVKIEREDIRDIDRIFQRYLAEIGAIQGRTR